MEVLTRYPVYVDNNQIAGEEDWLAFDSTGKPTNSTEIKQFQDWLDAKYPTWLKGGKLNKGKGYGVFGPSTSAAWGTYGAQFAKELGLVSEPVAAPTPAQIADAKKKGLTWDKVSGAFVKAKESGILDTALGLFKKGQGETPVTTSETPVVAPEEEKKGMSKGMKIALIGGGIILVGVTIWAMTRKKK